MSASQFTFDPTTAFRRSFPIPPALSNDAGELLCDMLADAFWVSARLLQRDHKRDCVPSARLEALCTEILRTNFPMPCEGTDEPIPTVDRIAMFPGGIEFTISEIYAAYLLSSVDVACVFRERRPASHVTGGLPLTQQDLPVVVAALRTHHQDFTLAWTRQAVHAANKGAIPLARDAFGLTEIERVLLRLGASIAP